MGSARVAVIMKKLKIKKLKKACREVALYNDLQRNISTAGEKILVQISVTPGKC